MSIHQSGYYNKGKRSEQSTSKNREQGNITMGLSILIKTIG